jgi:hypothetical protein
MNILDKFEAFSFGRLQDIANALGIMDKYNIPHADFTRAVRAEADSRVRAATDAAAREEAERREKARLVADQKAYEDKWRRAAPKCPECDAVLVARPIRAEHKKQNLFGYKTHWHCPQCLWERYSTNSFQEETAFLRKGCVNGA